uniref:hypothetical protein n=1 Tax=Gemmiger formicilis TaxID=745368 RepID=UPI00402698CD
RACSAEKTQGTLFLGEQEKSSPREKKDFWGSQIFSLKFGKRYKKQQKCDFMVDFLSILRYLIN